MEKDLIFKGNLGKRRPYGKRTKTQYPQNEAKEAPGQEEAQTSGSTRGCS